MRTSREMDKVRIPAIRRRVRIKVKAIIRFPVSDDFSVISLDFLLFLSVR